MNFFKFPIMMIKCCAVLLLLLSFNNTTTAQGSVEDRSMSVFITSYDSYGIRHIERIQKTDEEVNTLNVAKILKENIEGADILVHGYIKTPTQHTRYYFDSKDMNESTSKCKSFCKKVESSEVKAHLGIIARPTEDASGLMVHEIVDETTALQMGLQVGDIITHIDKAELLDACDIKDFLQGHQPGDIIEIRYIRNGEVVIAQGVLGAKEVTRITWVKCCETASATIYVNETEAEKNNVDAANLALTDVSVYPNPSNGLFELSFVLPTEEVANISISNLAGKEVYHEVVAANTPRYNSTINITKMPQGMYFLNITQNGLTHTSKVILQGK